MSDDSATEVRRQLPVPTSQQLMEYVSERTRAVEAAQRRRGKPATLRMLHLCLAIVLNGLEGFGSQLQLWRRLCLEPMGPFAPVPCGWWIRPSTTGWPAPQERCAPSLSRSAAG